MNKLFFVVLLTCCSAPTAPKDSVDEVAERSAALWASQAGLHVNNIQCSNVVNWPTATNAAASVKCTVSTINREHVKLIPIYCNVKINVDGDCHIDGASQ